MVSALDEAVKNNKLNSDCGTAVKNEYNTSSKQAMLENYADNVLNTVIYKIACDVMTANNSWVAQVISTYSQYCNNLLQRDSGINAFLNYIFLTHAFEGEVSGDIINFLEGMIAQAGFYGSFVLTCAGQDNLQTTAAKEQLQEYFSNTVENLDAKKNEAVTGHDNYCYVTGTILSADSINISSKMYVHRANNNAYTGCDVSSWEVTVPSIVNSVYLPIIYRQYTKFPNGTNSFGEYLHKYGVQVDNSNKTYLTQYSGVQTFAFSEGISMLSYRFIADGSYFSPSTWYRIDVGTGSKVEQKYYEAHDKVMGDLFDSSNGSQSINTMIAGRAFYGESHNAWTYDEAYGFSSEGVTRDTPAGYGYDMYFNLTKTADILKSNALHDLNGDAPANLNNPFFAFDGVSLIPEVSDHLGPVYQNQSKDITDVLLDSETYTYTGQPITPPVTVLCSGDVVPEDGYTVTYINNVESGDYGVVRVEGKGDYSGTITRHFTITADSDTPDTPAVSTLGSSGGGCNAFSGVCAAFGLVFLMKKFRRR